VGFQGVSPCPFVGRGSVSYSIPAIRKRHQMTRYMVWNLIALCQESSTSSRIDAMVYISLLFISKKVKR
jgi:hypothetical protein